MIRLKTFVSSVLFCELLIVFFAFAQPNHTTGQPLNLSWEKIGPGGGGAVFIPTFSYHSTSSFLLKCDMTGSYLTRDGGHSYHQINFPNGVSSFAYDPSDSNTVYIGSNTLNKSIDGGKSWQQLFPAKADIQSQSYFGDHATFQLEAKPGTLNEGKQGRIGSIRVDAEDPLSLYFGMGQLLFFTSDGGSIWQKKDIGKKIEHLYTNAKGLKNELIIFTPESVVFLM